MVKVDELAIVSQQVDRLILAGRVRSFVASDVIDHQLPSVFRFLYEHEVAQLVNDLDERNDVFIILRKVLLSAEHVPTMSPHLIEMRRRNESNRSGQIITVVALCRNHARLDSTFKLLKSGEQPVDKIDSEMRDKVFGEITTPREILLLDLVSIKVLLQIAKGRRIGICNLTLFFSFANMRLDGRFEWRVFLRRQKVSDYDPVDAFSVLKSREDVAAQRIEIAKIYVLENQWLSVKDRRLRSGVKEAQEILNDVQ